MLETSSIDLPLKVVFVTKRFHFTMIFNVTSAALQEFFISGGDGLPRGVVENLVARARNIIKLHGYEVSSYFWLPGILAATSDGVLLICVSAFCFHS